MRKREVYREQTISHLSVFLKKVSALENDRFMQASLCTVSLLFANTSAKVINPIISVAVIQIGFRFDKAKKVKSLGNSDDGADQITGRNNDNTLGIPRANLELKHWSSVHNFFQFGAMIDY